MTDWVGANVKVPAAVEGLLPVVSTVTGALSALVAVMELITSIAAMLEPISLDPLNAILDGVLNTLNDVLDKIGSLGFHFLYLMPTEGINTIFSTETLFDPNSKLKLESYNDVVNTLARTFSDPFDDNKPDLKEDNPFFALAFLAHAQSDQLKEFFDKAASLSGIFDGLDPKFDGLKGKLKPDNNFMGVYDPPEEWLDPQSVIELKALSDPQAAPPYIDYAMRAVVVEESGWVLFPDKPRLINKSTDTKKGALLVPGEVGFVLAVPYSDEEAIIIFSPVGKISGGQIEIDYSKYLTIGTKGVILAYLAVDTDGSVLEFDESVRNVVHGEPLPRTGESEAPDWQAKITLRDWEPTKELIQQIQQSTRKFQVPITKSVGVEGIGTLLGQIKDYLQDISTRLNYIGDTLKDVTLALSSGINVLWITPWPTIQSNPDPFNLPPNSQITYTENVNNITADNTVQIQATAATFESTKKIEFYIPDDTRLRLQISARNLDFTGGDFLPTLGLDSGSQVEQGKFGFTLEKGIRIPSFPSELILSTFAHNIELHPSSVLDMLGITPGTGKLGIQKKLQRKYHYPNGASFYISAWANKTDLLGGNLLPYLGWSNTTREPDGTLIGSTITQRKVVANTAFRISTKSMSRSYPPSPVSSTIGFVGGVQNTFVDQFNRTNRFFIPDLATLRFSLAIKNFKLLSGSAIPVLGLDDVVHSFATFEGDPIFYMTFPKQKFKISAKSNVIEVIPNGFLSKVKLDAVTNSRNVLQGTDARYFSWEEPAKFKMVIRNGIGVKMVDTLVELEEGVTQSGFAVASYLTNVLRGLEGSSKTEFVQYNLSTGKFTFFFGGLARSIELSDGATILPMLGLTEGVHNTLNGLIDGDVPAQYVIEEDDELHMVLGVGEFEVKIPEGRYTGYDLSDVMTDEIRLKTGKGESVTYDHDSGRFTIHLDTGGYKWFEDAKLEYPVSSQEPLEDIIEEFNDQLEDQEIPLTITQDGRKLNFISGGMSSITFALDEGLSDQVFGFPLVEQFVQDSFTGVEVKNFYFDPTEVELKVRKNRQDYTLTLPNKQHLSFEEVKQSLQSQLTGVTVSFEDHAFKFVLNQELNLATNQIIVLGPSVEYTNAALLAELKNQFDFFLADNLSELSLAGSEIRYSYPELSSFAVYVTGLGEDALAMLGWSPGINTVEGVYNGHEYRPYFFQPGNNILSLRLGVATYPYYLTTNRLSGTEIAGQITAASPVKVIYDPDIQRFTFSHDVNGYDQINDFEIALPVGVQNLSNIVSGINLALLTSPQALGSEKFVNSGNTVSFSDPTNLTISVKISHAAGKLRGLDVLGFIPQEKRAHNLFSSEDQVYFIDASNNTFTIDVLGNSYVVTLPSSIAYESGAEIANRLTSAIQAQTGGGEIVSYANRRFTLKPSPTGIQVLNNYKVMLSNTPGFISEVDLVTQINNHLSANVPSAGINISYGDNVFEWDAPYLARIELSAGDTGHDVLPFIGFNPGMFPTENRAVESNTEIKHLVLTALSNTLEITLGSKQYTITLPTNGNIYSLPDYMNIVQTEVRALSNRSTRVSNTEDNIIFSCDTEGEYQIENAVLNGFTPGITTLEDFAQDITNKLAAIPDALGGEEIVFEDGKFVFRHPNTVSISFTDDTIFNLRVAIGGSTHKLQGGEAILGGVKQYIITNENKSVSYEIDRIVGNGTLTEGFYVLEGIVSELGNHLPAPISFTDNSAIEPYISYIESGPNGTEYFNHPLIITPAFQGDADSFAAFLQGIIRADSPYADENIIYDNGRFNLYAPDILKAHVSKVFSPDLQTDYTQYYADRLGLTVNKTYSIEAPNDGYVVFDLPAPYAIGPSEDHLKITLDTLDPFEVSLDTLGTLVYRTGPATAQMMELGIRERLNSLAVAHIISMFSYIPYFDVMPPKSLFETAEVADYAVSYKFVKEFIEQITQRVLSMTRQEAKDSLVTWFSPETEALTKLFPKVKEVENMLGQAVSRIDQEFDVVRKAITTGRMSSFFYRALSMMTPSIPERLSDQLDNLSFSNHIRNTLNAAAAAEGIDALYNINVWNELLGMFESDFISALRAEINAKYFNDVTCEYLESSSTFLVTSATSGKGSKVIIEPASMTDVAVDLGFDTGTPTPGTGNVVFSHLVTATELADLIVTSTGLASYAWLSSAFTAAGDTFDEHHYPMRYYTRDELVQTAPVVTHPVSISWGSSFSLSVLSNPGSIISELGYPVGETKGPAGVDGFIGALRAAELDGIDKSDPSYYFVFATAVAVVPSATDTGSPEVVKMYEALKTIMGM